MPPSYELHLVSTQGSQPQTWSFHGSHTWEAQLGVTVLHPRDPSVLDPWHLHQILQSGEGPVSVLLMSSQCIWGKTVPLAIADLQCCIKCFQKALHQAAIFNCTCQYSTTVSWFPGIWNSLALELIILISKSYQSSTRFISLNMMNSSRHICSDDWVVYLSLSHSSFWIKL